MLKRILNYIMKDLTNALRDNLIIYVVLFPLLLSLGMKLFLPGVQSMKLTIAVDSHAEQKVVERLEDYAKVELFSSREEVIQRVEQPDDLCGIVKQGDEYVVYLEGNETGEAKEIAGMIMNMVLEDQPTAQFNHVSMGKNNSQLLEMMASLLVLTSILVGGVIVAMNIINEKEMNTVRALAVSPLKMSEFIAAHTILSVTAGLVLALISSFVLMGASVDYLKVVTAVISSIGVSLLVGFVIGGLADNLISAVAVMKLVFLVCISIPIASLFVPQSLQWVFYPFPHYWAFQSYQSIFNASYNGVSFAAACIIALASSILALTLLTPVLRNRLKLR